LSIIKREKDPHKKNFHGVMEDESSGLLRTGRYPGGRNRPQGLGKK
jgi:hypothetical protein